MATLTRAAISLGSIAVSMVLAWFLVLPFPHPSASTADDCVSEPASTPLPPPPPPTVESIKTQATGVVLVHGHIPGHRDSEQLKQSIQSIDFSQFGDRIQPVEFDATADQAQARIEGVSATEGPVLHFYLQRQRVSSHRGPWTKAELERVIRQVLDGFVERTAKGWLPSVHGLRRDTPHPDGAP